MSDMPETIFAWRSPPVGFWDERGLEQCGTKYLRADTAISKVALRSRLMAEVSVYPDGPDSHREDFERLCFNLAEELCPDDKA